MLGQLNKGIVLDGDLSRCFKTQAYKEGYLRNNGKELRDAAKILMGCASHSNHKELAYLAYSSIVLFDKIHLETWENARGNKSEWLGGEFIDYDQLVEDGVVSLSESKDKREIDLQGSIDAEDFASKRTLLINYTMSRTSTMFGRTERRQSYERAHDLLLRQIVASRRENEPWGLPFYDASNSKPKLHSALDDLYFSYLNLRHVIDETTRLGCPGRSLIPLIRGATQFEAESSEIAFRVYEIILEEECTFPFPRTLSSAIKLRHDKRVGDFREVIAHWTSALMSGDVSAEVRFRKEVTKASKELKRLSTYKRVGRIMTVISLPIAIASAMARFPFGLFLLPISQAIVVDSIRRERKHRWLLFGK